MVNQSCLKMLPALNQPGQLMIPVPALRKIDAGYQQSAVRKYGYSSLPWTMGTRTSPPECEAFDSSFSYFSSLIFTLRYLTRAP